MKNARNYGIISALKEKRNVMAAVVLRDMRTRFFNHGIGFLVVSLWPLAHIFILVIINASAGRQAPFGESMSLFLATGLVPTLAFMYVSRFMSYSLILNRPLLQFPIVTVLDVMAARAFLEIVAAALTLLFVLMTITLLGVSPFPYNPSDAVCAYMATILLAVGIGSLAGVIVMFFEFFITIYALLTIIIYITSGTLFVASSLPDQISVPLSWNPVLGCVEWMRTAYFESYSNKLVNKEYVVLFGAISLLIGLTLERAFRRVMLEG